MITANVANQIRQRILRSELLKPPERKVNMESPPVRLDCPIGCLALPERISLPLERDYPDPIKTVGDLRKFAEENRLSEIRGIGKISIETIEESLRHAGFPVRHRHAISHRHRFEPVHTHDADTSEPKEGAGKPK